MMAGKVWGNTQLIHSNGVLEFHRIEVNEGGKKDSLLRLSPESITSLKLQEIQ